MSEISSAQHIRNAQLQPFMKYFKHSSLHPHVKAFRKRCHKVTRRWFKQAYKGEWLVTKYEIERRVLEDPSFESRFQNDCVFEITPVNNEVSALINFFKRNSGTDAQVNAGDKEFSRSILDHGGDKDGMVFQVTSEFCYEVFSRMWDSFEAKIDRRNKARIAAIGELLPLPDEMFALIVSFGV